MSTGPITSLARREPAQSTWESLWYGPPTWRSALSAPALAPLSWLYSAGVGVRNALFDWGLRQPVRLEGALVVSVGNLIIGGAGKTPVTMFLARWAAACGRKVAVLSRGYGRSTTDVRHFTAETLPPVEEVGDEPRLIARRCPGIDVWVGPRRVQLALAARSQGADFLLLDDGFQHRPLHRDVDLVVWSGSGNGHRLPWGPLRESPRALSRASLVWATDGAAPPTPPTVRAETRVTHLVDADDHPRPVASLAHQPVVLLTGIARPQRVVRTLEALGARLVSHHAYADHHRFTAFELDQAQAEARRHGAQLVTTEKDRERLPAGFEALALQLDVELLEGREALAQALGLQLL